jgi:hypothetical protein
VRENTAFDIAYSPSSQGKAILIPRHENWQNTGENAPSLMAQLHRRSRHGGAEVLQFGFASF